MQWFEDNEGNVIVMYDGGMELFAETIAAVLKELRIRKCILVGHSLDGYIALAFADRETSAESKRAVFNERYL